MSGEKYVSVGGENIQYVVRKSRRAKHVRLSVYAGGEVRVTIPQRLSESYAERFVLQKAAWVISKVRKMANVQVIGPRNTGSGVARKDFLTHKREAFDLVQRRVEFFASRFGFAYRSIAIRNQKTCWGSCTRKGSLSFNYKIIYLSERAQDYIVVHELCHLKELNHSRGFWDLLAEIMPDYELVKREVKRFRLR